MENDAPNIQEIAIGIVAIAAFFWFILGRILVRAGYPRWWMLGMIVPLLNLYIIGKCVLKSGYSRWWMLMIFVPLGSLLMAFLFAFSEWPIDRMRRAHAE